MEKTSSTATLPCRNFTSYYDKSKEAKSVTDTAPFGLTGTVAEPQTPAAGSSEAVVSCLLRASSQCGCYNQF